MKIYDRLKKVREDNKGFTLVELIVVLVILAILAAILVPALLGYIDRAKESQYELEAKAVLTAMQGEASRLYATAGKGDEISVASFYDTTNSKLTTVGDTVQSTADVKGLVVNGVTHKSTKDSTGKDLVGKDLLHAAFTIEGVDITFDSANGNTVNCVLDTTTKSWTCTLVE